MELKFTKREAIKKSESKQLRRKGLIPAVIYGPGQANQNVAIDRADYDAALRVLPKRGLSTQDFTLKGEGGKSLQVIVKEVQYHPTTYDVLHLDFELLKADQLVNVNVPIRFVGAEESPGIKLGGVLRPVIRRLRVRCLPKKIPKELICSVKELKINQTRRLREIALPEGVLPLVDLNEVAVVIAKR